LAVVSKNGKEATTALLSAGDFVGEESIAGVVGLRMTTATAGTACTALKIERSEMIRVLHEEHAFSDLFLKFLLARSMRTQADLVDQLFNSSEKRLARILLLMAEFGRPGEPETLIPKSRKKRWRKSKLLRALRIQVSRITVRRAIQNLVCSRPSTSWKLWPPSARSPLRYA
jgi:CRP-like cAMP-binding protein